MTAPASRRRFLHLVGGGTVAAALPGCATGVPESATAAWKLAGLGSDVRRFMLAHALLAPNPHNRQPWLADLRRPDEITLVCDRDRLLPATDPFGRQIVVGCGAFIELAVLAAAERGVRVEVQAFPQGEPGPRELPGGHVVARLVLQPDAAVGRDPLFAQIPHRHTHRGAYDMARPVPAEAWAALRGAARGVPSGAVTEPARVQQLRELTRRAFELECLTPHTWLESARLMRIGPAAIEQHRDGIAIDALPVRMLHTLGLFDPLEVPVRGTASHGRVMEHFAPMATAASYFWLATPGNARTAQLAAGRAYVRAQLAATALGLAMQPMSQALQEFAEMAPLYAQVHGLLGFRPEATTVQMLARIGYAAGAARPSPRRELVTLLRVAEERQ